MKDDWRDLRRSLEARGYRASIVPASRSDDLRGMIESPRSQGAFDKEFFREQLTDFSFDPPAGMPAPASLIVVAVPVPQVELRFAWNGRPFSVVLPPTYLRYRGTTTRVHGEIDAIAGPRGQKSAPTALPLKSLAVGCGLGYYGKNNLCYVPGMGSFLQLVGCYSTIFPPSDEWPGPRLLSRCKRCEACRRACPTGAIREDRFLLSAERCLTFHNERHRKGFPAWIDPAWHNTLVGCLRCQAICPENKPFLSWIEPGERFDEEETRLLLSGPSRGAMPAGTAAKVDRLGLTESWTVLSRNLAAILPSARR
jgi:epoxyqueuosine reductase